ncbi:Fanconi anemia group J protein homolog [Artemia franciscana]|uniref:DNA 5'-3' helicase n=1 Tax=Artemia franciscana TaxID=6661 RepID=A0AA88L004_ARTSF|nr:hypothetical protein QYM36_012487 [Artemia franciscana]
MTSQSEVVGTPPQVGMQFRIGGKAINSPVKLYGVQHAAMNRIIAALENSEHALIESPTGTGKTLSLLCSVLAWQTDKKSKVELDQKEAWISYTSACQEIEFSETKISRVDQLSRSDLVVDEPKCEVAADIPVKKSPDTPDASGVSVCSKYGKLEFMDDDDDDFKETKSFRRISTPIISKYGERHLTLPFKNDNKPNIKEHGQKNVNNIEDSQIAKAKEELDAKLKSSRVPRVFYAVRTHRQAAQACKELKRTVYRRLPMTTLSSREHTCVNPIVSRSSNKTAECEKLLDPIEGAGCIYKINQPFRLGSFSALESAGLDEGWDIEDLVRLGRKVKACPYFAARDYAKVANLIFCPYNYILDYRIRESMQIQINGDIVIFDEAHNLEDACREAVSGTLLKESFEHAIKECKNLSGYYKKDAHIFTSASELCNVVITFLSLYACNIQMSPDSPKHFLNIPTEDFTRYFQTRALKKEVMVDIKSKLQKWVANSKEPDNKTDYLVRMTVPSVQIIEEFTSLFCFVFDNQKDYRISVKKEIKKNEQGATVLGESLNIWCLNPAVCFQELAKNAKTIILASGTLSPLDSFQSELGTSFKHVYEASHVIPKNQMWVGSVGFGPSGTPLKATYEFTSQFVFQDDLGKLVLDVCKVIPHGILMFVPSYTLMRKLIERWEQTGLIDEIREYKSIFNEPSSSDQMTRTMQEYYDCVNDDIGALLIAVFRGKASEGMDFADDRARAVICVGIPYPNVADPIVKLKREYNDKESKLPGSIKLNGSRWYEIQAFRALNQAIGRCLRHKNDWGAILLVDQRWNHNYSRCVSKWARDVLVSHSTYAQMRASLEYFASSGINC